MRQALADKATPMAKGELRWLRTVLALLLALNLVVGMTAIRAGPSAAESAAELARAGCFHLGTVRILGSGNRRGLAGSELLLDRTSYAASMQPVDPNHLGLKGVPEALRVVLWPTCCGSPLQRQSTAGR